MNRAFSKIVILVILVILAGGGLFAWQYFGVPKEEVKAPEEKIEEVGPEKITEDETANWNTYSNPTIGFSIKYPPDWEKSEQLLATATRIEFLSPREMTTWVRIGVYYDQTKGRETTFNELISGMKKSYEILKEEEMLLDSVPAKKLFLLWTEKKPGYLIFLQKEGERNIVEIGAEIQNPQKQDEYSLIFNQMLSAFKFLE